MNPRKWIYSYLIKYYDRLSGLFLWISAVGCLCKSFDGVFQTTVLHNKKTGTFTCGTFPKIQTLRSYCRTPNVGHSPSMEITIFYCYVMYSSINSRITQKSSPIPVHYLTLLCNERLGLSSCRQISAGILNRNKSSSLWGLLDSLDQYNSTTTSSLIHFLTWSIANHWTVYRNICPARNFAESDRSLYGVSFIPELWSTRRFDSAEEKPEL